MWGQSDSDQEETQNLRATNIPNTQHIEGSGSTKEDQRHRPDEDMLRETMSVVVSGAAVAAIAMTTVSEGERKKRPPLQANSKGQKPRTEFAKTWSNGKADGRGMKESR